MLSRSSYQTHAVRQLTTFEGVDFGAMVRERQEQAQQLGSAGKARILEALRADAEDWGRYLDAITEDELSVIIPFSEPAVPRTKSRFEMILSVKEHEMHHRAQLMVYQRLLGLVPHLTRERQARVAASATRT